MTGQKTKLGHWVKDVMNATIPKQVTLANNPNFIIFEEKKDEDGNINQHFEANLQVINTTFDKENERINELKNVTEIQIIDRENKSSYLIHGTYKRENVNPNTFFIAQKGDTLIANRVIQSEEEALQITAENLRECLRNGVFVRQNFEVSIPVKNDNEGNLVIGTCVKIKALKNNTKKLFGITWNNAFVDNIDIEPDLIFNLKDVEYTQDTWQMSTIELHLTSVLENDKSLITQLHGSFDMEDDNTFKIVLPNGSNITKEKSLRQTLQNICNCLNRNFNTKNIGIYKIRPNSYIIECYFNRILKDIDKLRFYSNESFISYKHISDQYNPNRDEKEELIVQINHNNNSLIELDIYTDTQCFLGQPNSPHRLGKYLTSLSKQYNSDSVWFELNGLMSKRVEYSTAFLESNQQWCNTGTMSDYSFVAKRSNGINHETFLYSNPFYVINGYDSTLEPNELTDYIFDVVDRNIIKSLTNRPTTNHIKGQKQYFNFILKDPFHDSVDLLHDLTIGIMCKMYTQSGKYFGQQIVCTQPKNKFDIVNTIELNLDNLIELQEVPQGQEVGRIEVALCCNGIETSTPICYNIQPQNWFEVRDFVFLNRLGGWDSINFGGTLSNEFKTSTETMYKTLTPDYKIQSEIESVARKSVNEQMTVQTIPINIETAKWLRELSTSPAVYELSTKRYVIVDDLRLKYNSKDDLYQVEMKYHYSDTFNTKIK